MRLIVLILLLVIQCVFANAQKTMYVYSANGTEDFEISNNDSAYFNSEKTIIYFDINGLLSEYNVFEIDSITFDLEVDSTIYIDYDGATATIVNPFEGSGIDIIIDGADVTVYSNLDLKDLNFVLTGSSGDGMFKMYSERRFNLHLNGITLTNPDGPAINIQSGKKVSVHLIEGTINTICDGSAYSAPVSGSDGEEDQSAAFFSEGQLIFLGTGELLINGTGSDQHGLRSDDYIQVDEGTITVASSVKDGIHAKDGYYQNGGTVTVTSTGDGVDGAEGVVEIAGGSLTISSTVNDVKGIKCDSTITISGGSVSINIEGDQSRGIDSDYLVDLQGGSVYVQSSGYAVLEASGQGYDPSYCAAIKCDGDIIIGAADIDIISQAEAGRGISSDGDLSLTNADLSISASGYGQKYTNAEGAADACFGSCLNVDGNLSILSGNVSLSHSGSGGRGISADGDIQIGDAGAIPDIEVTTTGSEIEISSGSTGGGGGRPPGGDEGDYAEAKTIKCDGTFTMNSGVLAISSADDGIKALTAVIQNGGVINVTRSTESVEAPNIEINNGEIYLVASDDGFNATNGSGGEANDGSILQLNGGYMVVDASTGDAIDSNGNINITGGVIVAHGPQSSPEVGIDVNGTCLVSGGFLVVSGTDSNMTEGASSSSTQFSLIIKTYSSLTANTLFHIEDSEGNDIVTFAPRRRYYSIVFSSDQLSNSTTYSIYTGGTSTGTLENGLYTGGEYSGGTFRKSFTIGGSVTNVSF